MEKPSRTHAKNADVTIHAVNGETHTSPTDPARHSSDRTGEAIRRWPRPSDTIPIPSTWEKTSNPKSDSDAAAAIPAQSGRNILPPSASERTSKTNAIGIRPERGRSGGTHAHKDTASASASWTSPGFHLFAIKDHQRPKDAEAQRTGIERHARREPTKTNHRPHTDAAKEPPQGKDPSKSRERIEHASETDVTNPAAFGTKTATWKTNHPGRKGKHARPRHRQKPGHTPEHRGSERRAHIAGAQQNRTLRDAQERGRQAKGKTQRRRATDRTSAEHHRIHGRDQGKRTDLKPKRRTNSGTRQENRPKQEKEKGNIDGNDRTTETTGHADAYPHHRGHAPTGRLWIPARRQQHHMAPRQAQQQATPMHPAARAYSRRTPRPGMRRPIRSQMRAPPPQGDRAGIDQPRGPRHLRGDPRRQRVADGRRARRSPYRC